MNDNRVIAVDDLQNTSHMTLFPIPKRVGHVFANAQHISLPSTLKCERLMLILVRKLQDLPHTLSLAIVSLKFDRNSLDFGCIRRTHNAILKMRPNIAWLFRTCFRRTKQRLIPFELNDDPRTGQRFSPGYPPL
jgi:hypothetical protein